MIEPDEREIIWYDINSFINIEPDLIPHYFTTLIDKFSLFGVSAKKPICLKCNHHRIFDFKNKLYCINEYEPTFNNEGDIVAIKKYIETELNHNIIMENLHESIRRIVTRLLDKLKEPSGYRMDLFDLESYMYNQPEDNFFETMQGEVTKNEIRKELYQLKKLLISELTMLRSEIRFTAMMRPPSIRM